MTEISNSARLLLALSQLQGVGPATLKKVVATPRFGQCTIDEIAEQVPTVAKALRTDGAWGRANESAEGQVREAQRHQARILCMLDPDYPALLAATKDDPLILYVRGSLAAIPENSVAIIGTREPTTHGMMIAKRITQFFAESKWSVVSGLAIGCDTLAHEAALEAGAHTVAVLAHGLQMIAPARNRKLADRILSGGGALVSEYPFGREVQKQQYVERDRTQAGLAQGVVMIQSDLVGGSLHASRAALDYKRWLAVPYPTAKDRERNEPKIQANLLIAHGENAKRADLLRCPISSLTRVLILNSREDYLLMKLGAETVAAKAADQPPLAPQLDLLQHAAPNEEKPKAEAMTIARDAFSDDIARGSEPDSSDADPQVPKITLLIDAAAIVGPTSALWNAPRMSSSSIAAAITARLAYLQTRHHRIQKSLERLAKIKSEAHQQALVFAVDDFVSQMWQAAELLVALHSLAAPSDVESETTAFDIEARPKFADNDGRPVIVSALSTDLASKLQALRESSTERLIQASEVHELEEHELLSGLDEAKSISFRRYGVDAVVKQISEISALFNQLANTALFQQPY